MLIEALAHRNELIIFILLLTKPTGTISTSSGWRIASHPTTWYSDRLLLHLSFLFFFWSSLLSFSFVLGEVKTNWKRWGRPSIFPDFSLSVCLGIQPEISPDKFKFMYEILMSLCRPPSCYISPRSDINFGDVFRRFSVWFQLEWISPLLLIGVFFSGV